MAGIVVAKVYGHGEDGKQLGEAFHESFFDDWSTVDEWHVIMCQNYELTGEKEYVIVCIVANDVTSALFELDAQCVDGLFENYAVGDVEVCDAYDCLDVQAVEYVHSKARLILGEEPASKLY